MRRFFASVVAMTMLFGLNVDARSVMTDPATVYVVHGIPGVKVDVCANGAEVRSNFKYGRFFGLEGLEPGNYNIKVFLANPDKECRGTLVIQQRATLSPGDNVSAVARLVKGVPSLSFFVNDTGLSGTGVGSGTVRHVAKAPKVDVWVNGSTIVEDLGRGEEVGPIELPDGLVVAYWASAVDDYAPVIGPDVTMVEGGIAFQIFAVGTDASNYRFVVFGQPGHTT
jgi:hypothetical protein